MPLSHVLMWTEEHGYRRVTPDEATLLYPEKVSARSGLFICEICKERVTFTAEGRQARHFRHDSAALNKDCEERSVQYDSARYVWSFQRDLQVLPLRLVQTEGQYRLELGLLALSIEQLERYSGQMLYLKGQSITKVFSYDITERFFPDQLTWLGVGDVPDSRYSLSISGGRALPPLWPHQVEGIENPALFDAETGKRLPPSPYVVVGREYILAIKDNDFNTGNPEDIHVVYIFPQEHRWNGWNLYRVKARQFNRSAACFFLQVRATLTRHPPSIFPLWPTFVRTPHLIYHNADDIFVFVEGEGSNIYLFPEGKKFDCGNEHARIICFMAGTRKQMLSGIHMEQLLEVGPSHILRYDYFIRRELNQTAPQPEVSIKDQRGTILQEDWIKGIPPRGKIRISASFDGEVWLEHDGFLVNRKKLKGGDELELTVNTGQTLTIFQGLDRIRSIVFARPNLSRPGVGLNKGLWNDALLCRRLRRLTGDEVPTVHVLTEAVRFFQSYRATGAWLRMRKAEGSISARALSLLLTLMNK